MKWNIPLSFALAAAISAAAQPTVHVAMGPFPDGETPAFTVGDEIRVVVSNTAGRVLEGPLSISIHRWDGEIAFQRSNDPTFQRSKELSAHAVATFSLPTAALAPDGYILAVEDAGGETVSQPLQFGLFAPYDTRGLYGVGNGIRCGVCPHRFLLFMKRIGAGLRMR